MQKLQAEYRTAPRGLDTPQPRLSWQVASEARAKKQQAYRILVASSPEQLRRDEGDLWDSGRVRSDRTMNSFNPPSGFTGVSRASPSCRLGGRDDFL